MGGARQRAGNTARDVGPRILFIMEYTRVGEGFAVILKDNVIVPSTIADFIVK
jgi:hypothetical protein